MQQIDLQNTEFAFRAKSDVQLKRTYQVFRMIDSPFLTKIGPKLLRFAMAIGLPINGLVKRTLFDIFCGGESITDTEDNSIQLSQFGVRTILDYSVESEHSEQGFNKAMEEIIATLKFGKARDFIAFSACKLSAMASVDLLEKVQKGESLTREESSAFKEIKRRIDKICQAAADNRTPVFIDAEESWIQGTIDQLAEEMMEKYNRETAVVYTTVQLYRSDRLAYLSQLIERSEEKNYTLGIKLVRGAYIEKETLRAEDQGYDCPIHLTKAATDADFDAALHQVMNHLDHIHICAGTHNEKSSLLLTELMEAHNIAANDSRIWFAQLLGMSDNISFNLSHKGYNVAKYLPYGPVKAVVPYLIRRAEENTAIAGQSSREVQLLRKEIKRRGL